MLDRMLLVLAIFVILAVAAAVQAATAFGFALIAVPLLALTADVSTGVVGVALAGLLLNLGTVHLDWAHIRWRPVIGLLAAAGVGMPFGLFILRSLDERALKLLVAAVVLACTLLVWRRPAFPTGWPVVAAVGVLAGVLATATGMNGPPLLALFLGMGFVPAEVRASLAVYFSVSTVLAVAAFAVAGELTGPAYLIGAVGLVAVPLGWWLGNRVFRRFDAAGFRRAVLVMLLFTSVVTAVRAAMG
jgi:uncharacterized membrane protein YfcA